MPKTALAVALTAAIAAAAQPALAETPQQLRDLAERWDNRVEAGLDALDRLQGLSAAPTAETQNRIIGILIAIADASADFQAASPPPGNEPVAFCYQKIIWTFKGTDEEIQAATADGTISLAEARALAQRLDNARGEAQCIWGDPHVE